MAIIANKSTTSGHFKMLILNSKEALRVPFTIQDWTRIRAGILFSFTATGDNNNMDNFGTYSTPLSSETERAYMGLKKYSTRFPGSASQEYFVGLTNSGTTSYITFPNTLINSATILGDTANHGVLHSDGTLEGNSYTAPSTTYDLGGTADSWDNTASFSTVLGIDLEIVNKGQANQQVIYKFGKSAQITAPNRSDIETALNGITYTTVGTLDFNDGVSAYPLPDCFFLYLPFGTIRLRIHSLDVIRLS